MAKHPFVIWMGRQPLDASGILFRVVDRGPARENRSDDVPFALEQRIGISMMKRHNWGPPRSIEAKQEAIHALVHAYGQLLTVDPKKLDLNHPLHCEVNLAVAEGREPKGCDCNGPADPLDTGDAA
jgi:hypothetical protein